MSHSTRYRVVVSTPTDIIGSSFADTWEAAVEQLQNWANPLSIGEVVSIENVAEVDKVS